MIFKLLLDKVVAENEHESQYGESGTVSVETKSYRGTLLSKEDKKRLNSSKRLMRL